MTNSLHFFRLECMILSLIGELVLIWIRLWRTIYLVYIKRNGELLTSIGFFRKLFNAHSLDL